MDSREYINAYGRSLNEVEKKIAKTAFTELLEMGFSFEWLEEAIRNFEKANYTMSNDKNRLFSKIFQQDITNKLSLKTTKEKEYEERKKRINDALIRQLEKKPTIIHIAKEERKINKGYIDLSTLS